MLFEVRVDGGKTWEGQVPCDGRKERKWCGGCVVRGIMRQRGEVPGAAEVSKSRVVDSYLGG